MTVAPLRVEHVRWREASWEIDGGGAARGVTTRTARLVEVTLATLTSLMEPFLMVFLGVIIGSIVIAMFLPIFKLPEIVNGK